MKPGPYPSLLRGIVEVLLFIIPINIYASHDGDPGLLKGSIAATFLAFGLMMLRRDCTS